MIVTLPKSLIQKNSAVDKRMYCAAIVWWLVPLVRNHEVTGLNPTPVRFESNVSVLSGLSINYIMAWVADGQVRAMLCATLAVR